MRSGFEQEKMESDTAVLEGDMEVLYSFALKKRRLDLWDIIGVVWRHRSIGVDFPNRGIHRVHCVTVSQDV